MRYKTCAAANSSTIGLGRAPGKIGHLVVYNAEWRKPSVLNICCYVLWFLSLTSVASNKQRVPCRTQSGGGKPPRHECFVRVPQMIFKNIINNFSVLILSVTKCSTGHFGKGQETQVARGPRDNTRGLNLMSCLHSGQHVSRSISLSALFVDGHRLETRYSHKLLLTYVCWIIIIIIIIIIYYY